MQIIFSRQELKAAHIFASNDESRYVLNGVLIEVTPGKKPMLVACDGRRLCAIETVAEQSEEFSQDHSLNIRADFVDLFFKLSKACGGKVFPWVCIENNPGSKRVIVTLVGGKVALDVEEGALIEGIYPDWRKVVPPKFKQRDPITDIGLNAEFIGDFARAAKILECDSPTIQMNLVGKEKCVEVKMSAYDSFYGLVMQCKLDESVDYQPEFLKIVEGLEPQKREEAA